MKERSIEWRRKAGRIMQRSQSKLSRGRKISAGKQPSEAKVKKAAGHAALAILRKKYAGATGVNYGKLTAAQKVNVDKLISRQVQTKTITALAKSLVPKIRGVLNRRRMSNKAGKTSVHAHVSNVKKAPLVLGRHPALHPSADPSKHIKEGQNDRYKSIMHRKAAHARSQKKHPRAQGRMYQGVNANRESNHSRANSREARKLINKMGARLSGGGSKIDAKSVGNHLRNIKNATKLSQIARYRRHANKIRRNTGRGDTMDNIGWNKSSQRIVSDMSTVEYAVGMIREDVVQDRIESLFIRGMIPKGQIQRYRRVLNDPKRYIRFRQYHDDILDLLRKLMEYTAEDDVIFQKVRNKVMARNHGRT